jgi:hypothetical protein
MREHLDGYTLDAIVDMASGDAPWPSVSE